MTSAAAQTLHVDGASGSDAASGRSWGEAFASVRRGLEVAREAARDGGGRPRVLVAEGSHLLADAVVDFPVALVGGFPPGGGPRDRAARVSRLDASSADAVLTFAGGSAGSVLDGFLVTGAASTALTLLDAVTVRNCTVADNAGQGILARTGRLERNAVLRNGWSGIVAITTHAWPPPLGGCDRPLLVSRNLVAGNVGTGLFVADGCVFDPNTTRSPVATIRHNRILSTERHANPSVSVAGMRVSCCPVLFNNEVAGTDGPGVLLQAVFTGFSHLPDPPEPAFLTVRDSTGPALAVHENLGHLFLAHSILSNNAGGDVDFLPAVTDISHVLSEAPLPGPGNLSGLDPLFVPCPDGGSCLSQVAAGQAADSPAVDAGGTSADAAGVGPLTTRTDGVRDSGRADLGAHADPPDVTLFRGSDPVGLPVHLSGVTLPALDPGAAAPGEPVLFFYRVDSDEEILLRREATDVEVRFLWQEFD